MLKEAYLIATIIVAQQGCGPRVAPPTGPNPQNSGTSGDHETFLAAMEKGNQKLTEKDFDAAGRAFQEANGLAKKRSWVNEIVSSTVRLGEASVGKGNIALAEELYAEAVRTCESEPNCTIGQFEVAVRYLNQLCLFHLKDPQKAAKALVQVDSSAKCSSGECDEFICALWKRIDAAGAETSLKPGKCTRKVY